MNSHRFIITVSKLQLSALATQSNLLNMSPEEVMERLLERIGFSSADVSEEVAA